MSKTDASDFTLRMHPDGNGVTLLGIMRLVSPTAYRKVLGPVYDAMGVCAGTFQIDIADLQFMNSSGITALSRLVMLARERNIGCVCVVNDSYAWQRKTLLSLQRLYPKFELRSR